jgi:hypothetical protein
VGRDLVFDFPGAPPSIVEGGVFSGFRSPGGGPAFLRFRLAGLAFRGWGFCLSLFLVKPNGNFQSTGSMLIRISPRLS